LDPIKLVKKAIRGNKSSFTQLIQHHEEMLYRVSYSVLRSDSDCADAIQETILKAYDKIHTLKEPKYFKTWLTRILLNNCYDQLRDRQRVIPMEWLKESQGIDKGYEKIEVQEFVNMLGEESRTAIILFYFEGFSIREIAELLDCPESTVKTRLHRGRIQLEKKMTESREGECK
jgi:RNA polymerase sigma-70 factor, ECF subfamily